MSGRMTITVLSADLSVMPSTSLYKYSLKNGVPFTRDSAQMLAEMTLEKGFSCWRRWNGSMELVKRYYGTKSVTVPAAYVDVVWAEFEPNGNQVARTTTFTFAVKDHARLSVLV